MASKSLNLSFGFPKFKFTENPVYMLTGDKKSPWPFPGGLTSWEEGIINLEPI